MKQEADITTLEKESKLWEAKSKRDVNNYLMEESDPKAGFEQLMKFALPYIETLTNTLPSATNPKFQVGLDVVLSLIASQQELAWRTYLKSLAVKTGLRTTSLESALKKVVQKSKNTLGVSSNATVEKNGLIKPIYIGELRPIHSTLSEIFEELKKLKKFFQYGSHLTLLQNDLFEIVKSAPGILYHLNSQFSFWHKEDKDGVKLYCSFPLPLAATLISSSSSINNFPRVDLYLKAPALNRNFDIIPLGYDEANHTYRAGVDVQQAQGIPLLTEILSGFCFESFADLTNAVALLLTAPVKHLFPGASPAFALVGNQPKVGKSLFGQVASIEYCGVPTANITYTSDQEEIEKRTAGIAMMGLPLLKYDNVKPSRNEKEISSPVIERTITDPVVGFRILGTNKIFTLANNFTVIFTLNQGNFSPDLDSRMVYISFKYEGDPKLREFKHTNLLEHVQNNSQTLQEEIIWMWEQWKAAGRPLAKIKHRFQRWAETVGGVLQVAGFNDFLNNSDQMSSTRDIELIDFEQMAAVCQVGHSYKARELCEKVRALGLFHDLCQISNPQARVAQFGRILSRFINRQTQISGSLCIFVKGTDSEKSATYTFQIGSESRNREECMVLPLRP